MNKLNNKRGISLIVLVITIIVMIVLAAAIILSLQSSGIIRRANEAQEKSDEANMLQAANVAYSEYVLEKNLGKTDKTPEQYVEERLREQGFNDKQLKLLLVTDEGEIIVYKNPVIPKGFVVSDIETEDDISEGLVIYEGVEKVSADEDAMTTRNQYVWIPVPQIGKFVRSDGYSKGVLQAYVSSGEISEPYDKDYNGIILSDSNDLSGEYAEYSKMRASVEKYGGFYIARYEAGTTNQRKQTTDGTSFKSDGITPDVLSQKDKYPYNCLGWGGNQVNVENEKETYFAGYGAVKLARSVYSENSNNGVVSTLIYGVQWDAVMNFMKDVENPNAEGEKFIKNSIGMTWDYNNKGKNANHKTGIDIDINKSNMVKNIYDIAGNLSEWTMEGYGAEKRVVRGGNSNASTGFTASASCRGASTAPSASDWVGFRVALYLE